MPSLVHEAILLLFRNRPTLAAEVLHDTFGVELPAFMEARIESADLTDVQPREHRADHVVLLVDERPRLAIVVEAQLAIDADKAYSWPAYQVGLRARHRCPACLLVVTTDPAVAAWAARPIELGPCGSALRPLVLGPAAVPLVTAPDEARKRPEVAVLSVLAHGREERGLEIATATLAGTVGLDEERARLYLDVVLSSLNEAARGALEAMMASGGYEYQSEFARKYVAQGKAEGEAKGKAEGEARGKAAALITVLEARGVAVPDEARQRIQASADLAELERWLRLAVNVGSVEDLFGAAGA